MDGASPSLRWKGVRHETMTPLGQATYDILEKLVADALEQLDGVPEADLNGWTPAQGLEDINTFYVLATHLVGAGEYWLLHGLGGRSTDRHRPDEFVATGTLVELTARYDRWLADARELLENITDADLARTWERKTEDGTEQISGAWSLMHAIEHTGVHVGHLQIQRQLWNAELRDRR